MEGSLLMKWNLICFEKEEICVKSVIFVGVRFLFLILMRFSFEVLVYSFCLLVFLIMF